MSCCVPGMSRMKSTALMEDSQVQCLCSLVLRLVYTCSHTLVFSNQEWVIHSLLVDKYIDHQAHEQLFMMRRPCMMLMVLKA